MIALPTTGYTAGMPELAFAGLSEHWLLKECGQRHWQGIAQAHGLALPRFHDLSGRPAYAAFTAISLTSARLDRIGEHQRFDIAGDISPAGRSQYISNHMVTTGGQRCVSLRMLSAFVQRLDQGNNQSVARATIKGSVPTSPGTDEINPGGALLETARQFRRRQQDRAELPPPGADKDKQLRLSPCPNLDFNGASFMYFASFQAMVERAEWAWFQRGDLPQLEERQMFFHGNVNVGDDVIVRLAGLHQQADELRHWCQLIRASDGVAIGDVVTRKRHADGAAA
jgi:probable biosynthetic protein (TIGR04099 family)